MPSVLASPPVKVGLKSSAGLPGVPLSSTTTSRRTASRPRAARRRPRAAVFRIPDSMAGASIPLVGGCAGDDLKMRATHQLYGDKVLRDAVIGAAKRKVSGVSTDRVGMIIAVLEKRAEMRLAADDVFVNIAGGVKVIEADGGREGLR